MTISEPVRALYALPRESDAETFAEKQMKDLLSQNEREQVLARIRKQKFSKSRKNVAPWCMQWISLAFSVLWLAFYFAKAEFGWTRNLMIGLAWLAISLLNHIQWERYKEQWVLKEMMGESANPAVDFTKKA
jgi:hypothetical protein